MTERIFAITQMVRHSPNPNPNPNPDPNPNPNPKPHLLLTHSSSCCAGLCRVHLHVCWQHHR